MVAKKLPGTLVCKIDQFQSFVSAFNILSSCKIHFTPNGIMLHTLDTGNVGFTTALFRVEVQTPLSIAIQLNTLQSIKSNDITIYTDGHNLILHDDGINYKCAPLADPMLDKKDRDPPPVTWDYVDLSISNDYIKKILTMVNEKNKYDFNYEDGTLTIVDSTDMDRDYTIPTIFEPKGVYTTRLQGDYVSEIFMAPKHFDHCVLSLGTDSPMRVSYSNDWMELSFFVAPMIDKEA